MTARTIDIEKAVAVARDAKGAADAYGNNWSDAVDTALCNAGYRTLDPVAFGAEQDTRLVAVIDGTPGEARDTPIGIWARDTGSWDAGPIGTSMGTEEHTYRVWGLDVWGHAGENCEEPHDDDCSALAEDMPCDCNRHDQCDGFTVNDRSKLGTVTLVVQGVRYNAGTPQEFTSYVATDAQLVQALKDADYLADHVKVSDLDIDGESDFTLYVDRESDGRPLLQLERETEE